ncbi:hypothetical protein [Rhizobium leguminosarum]|uniref:hypothetical protein n=1 Tax=Rhizobium leguminosarum TaxID=384 RepID=UPI003F9CCD05
MRNNNSNCKDRDTTRILIVGYGVLGGMTLDLLNLLLQNVEFFLVGRDGGALAKRVNTALAVGGQMRSPCNSIIPIALDVYNVEALAGVLREVNPTIIFNASSILPWWRLGELPQSWRERLDLAEGGAWTPTDAVLPYKLMQAVTESGVRSLVVNGSYADVLNPALTANGMGPAIGVGNVANPIPMLRNAAAFLLGVPPSTVDISLVAHHYVSHRMPELGHTNGAPYLLSISVDGSGAEVDHDSLFKLLTSKFGRVRGLAGQSVTAAAAASVVRELATGTGKKLHAPGIGGLPGGYPVWVTAGHAEVAMPQEYALEQAIDVNRKGQRWDGIEDIDATGRISFTASTRDILKEVLNFDCASMRLTECEEIAYELKAKYEEFARRVGVRS